METILKVNIMNDMMHNKMSVHSLPHLCLQRALPVGRMNYGILRYTSLLVHNVLIVSSINNTAGLWAYHVQNFKMVLGEEDGEIPQNFGSVRLVGGESLVAHRTVFSKDSKYVIYLFISVLHCTNQGKIWSHWTNCLPFHRILFCCCGRRIRVYSASTGDLLRELKGHEGKVTDIKVNPRNHLQVRAEKTIEFSNCRTHSFNDFNPGLI